ncbi:Hypp1335 [Branchiostoma lanceolatum]|uniref:Hypp1335 protein n=1 Tax=Branchiostoma lanceolatum TaxID=7740 RepID=A0A8J9ZJB6_BRALA|nr:Hypp1335 [Branchiostoma lanceolatum]
MTSSLRVPIAADILVFTRRPAARARQQSCRQKKFSEMEESEIVCPLSDYARSLAPHVRQRYQEKISAVGIDPFLIQDEQLDADRLPPMESLDLVSYLVLETSFYSQERFKAYKSLEAYNYVVSGFVESVKGKRMDGKHVVVGKVKHSQKWNDPCVLVWVITSPGGTILSAHCRDCLAGLEEEKKHTPSEGEMNELFENLDKVKFKPVVLSTDEQHLSDSRQAKIAVERITPDLEHWNTVVPKLAQFWSHISPEDAPLPISTYWLSCDEKALLVMHYSYSEEDAPLPISTHWLSCDEKALLVMHYSYSEEDAPLPISTHWLSCDEKALLVMHYSYSEEDAPLPISTYWLSCDEKALLVMHYSYRF